jgi:fatty acid desaturase
VGAGVRPLTKVWAVAMILAWPALVVGWDTGSIVLIGAATVVFLVFTVERFENWKQVRAGRTEREEQRVRIAERHARQRVTGICEDCGVNQLDDPTDDHCAECDEW